MLILKKDWGFRTLTPVDDIPLVRNSKVIIKKIDGDVTVCSCNDNCVDCGSGSESKTETPILVSLDEIESMVLSIIDEYMRNGTEISSLADTALGAYICIYRGLFTEEQWNKKIDDMYLEIDNMTDDMMPKNSARLNIVQLVYSLKKQSGCMAVEYKDMIVEHATRQIISEHIGEDNCIQFRNDIWTAVNGLIEKKVLISTIHSINDDNRWYYFSNKMLLVKLNNNQKQNRRDNSEELSLVYNKFSDSFENGKNSFKILHEKHPDDVIDFNLVTPTAGGISLTQDCQLRCNYCSFSSGDCKNKTLNIDSIKAFVDMLIKNIVKKKLLTKHIDCLEILIAGGGEPTYKWSTFVAAVEYIKEAAEKQKIPYSLNITTNGCHSEEQTEYIIQNFEKITVSFDGLPDTQNKNRPFANGDSTFDVVHKSIKQFDNAYAPYSLLSVVKHEDLSKLLDMALFVFENYPNVRYWSVRPPIAIGRAVAYNAYECPENGIFAKAYLDTVSSLGYPRKMNSGIFSSKHSEVFCGALYGKHPWLLPDDIIVTCQDAGESPVIMGRIEDGIITLEKVQDIYASKAFEYMNECKSCLAYNYCCGDCSLKKMTTEMKMYSSWKCGEIKKYWELVFSKLELTGNCDGWYLDKLSVDELHDQNIDIYKLMRL